MPSKIRTVEEMSKELEGLGYIPVGVVGARDDGDYFMPANLKLIWGLQGVWEAKVDVSLSVAIAKGKRWKKQKVNQGDA